MVSAREHNKSTWKGVKDKPNLTDCKRLLRMMGLPVGGTRSAISHRLERTLRKDQVVWTGEEWALTDDVEIVDPNPVALGVDKEEEEEEHEGEKRVKNTNSTPPPSGLGSSDSGKEAEKPKPNANNVKPKPTPSPLPEKRPPRKRARVRCGECDACQREDCGKCEQCVKKKKFGGDGTSKEACIHRRCGNLKERPVKPVVTRIKSGTRKRNNYHLDGGASPKTPRPNPRRKREKQGRQAVVSVKRERRHYFGLPCPKIVKKVCGKCNGDKDREYKEGTILMCDGCDREFHMKCCEPTLYELPSSSYYCLDCDKQGSTYQLEVYFDQHHEERAKFDSSRAFVENSLHQKLREEDEGSKIPLSELARATRLHNAAINDQKFDKSNRTKPKKLTAEFLVGKPVRMYCSVGNMFHSGRIIAVREAGHSEEFWPSEFDSYEYLVRFPAGKDFRKESYQQWVILEEHALAVGSTLLWGLDEDRRGIFGWRPCISWLRTSLELLPVQSELSESTNQIYFVGDEVVKGHGSWALVSFYGDEKYSLLRLSDEATDFFSRGFAQQRVQRHRTSKELRSKHDMPVGLAVNEWEEQRRAKKWHALPLSDAIHSKALTVLNELNLSSPAEDAAMPCIPHDLDRLYIAGLLGPDCQNKDTAGVLVFERLDPGPSSISREQTGI